MIAPTLLSTRMRYLNAHSYDFTLIDDSQGKHFSYGEFVGVFDKVVDSITGVSFDFVVLITSYQHSAAPTCNHFW
jgi:hypothetical protein